MPQFPFLVIITSVLFEFDSQLSSVSYIYFFFLLCDSVHLCLVSSQLCLIPISPQRVRALSTIVPLFTVSLSVALVCSFLLPHVVLDVCTLCFDFNKGQFFVFQPQFGVSCLGHLPPTFHTLVCFRYQKVLKKISI